MAEAARRPTDEAAIALVRAWLAHRSNHVVARAARAAREADVSALTPDLIAAFPRFLEGPVARPGLVAKTQIVHALLARATIPDVYLVGAAHVQREPAFGAPIDTAPELRATSALALVVTEHPAALTTCVNLLVDPEPAARAGALRALGASGRQTSPCSCGSSRSWRFRPRRPRGGVAALLVLSADDPVPFVAERLGSGDRDVARAAAVALGEARRPEAVGALHEHLTRELRPDVRHASILALATSRDDDALAVLLEQIARGTAGTRRRLSTRWGSTRTTRRCNAASRRRWTHAAAPRGRRRAP